EPPLSPKSTRTQRQEYLLATEEALSNLRKLTSAPAARVVISPSLLPENRGDEILAISRLLAVDLADAIDRSNPGRAEATLRVAMRYADMVSCESVSSWVTAGAVSDSLAQGIKSVGRQLDSKMTDTLRRVIDEVDKKPPNSSKAIEGTMARMSAWQTN